MDIALPQIKKILFTTDLSKQTSYAFNYAVGLAAQYGASLTMLFVMEDPPASPQPGFQRLFRQRTMG